MVFRFFCLYWVLWLSPIWKPEAATYKQTGSGDTTLRYVHVFLSLVAGSMLDRRREQYVRLHSWLRLLIRYSLAGMLMGYGYSKVFLSQFPENSLSRL